uniref:Uncharacterized protein n=1 Tax=Cairina moschata TaxID=8855 RepID=A0A8C3BLP8_CAIMO
RPRQDPLVSALNKLRSIAGVSKLCNLKKLILSKNEIVDFPKEIQRLVWLEKLELNQNQIRVIPEGIFSHLPRLKHLRLNNNRLGALPRDLAACRGSLQYLNISNNLFRTFPQPVLQLANLQELHVQNNALRQLPKELFQGQSLKMFRANGNPLREPPSEVCAGGIQQILNYFNQLQHGSGQEDKRVKTMFLGASLAGKSTICKSLKQRQSKLVSDIMSKIAAMLVERKNNLAHFINNLEDSEEPEFYVDQWERLKEMENHMLTVGSIIVDLLQLSGELGKLAGFGVLTQARLVGYLMP